MNKKDYKDSIDKLSISPDFNEKTARIMQETRNSRQKNHFAAKRMILSFASLAIIVSAATFALNHDRLFPVKDSTIGNTGDSSVLSVATEAGGITVPVTELPSSSSAGTKADMIGLFVYQGRVYLQSNTSFITDDNYEVDENDMLKVRGDYLGRTIGTINEWSKQDAYATEFASTIGENDVYTVKGYDSNHRLMVYSEYEDGFSCGIYDSFGGQVLNSGADYFDVLKLQDHIVSYQWESYNSWNNGIGNRTEAEIDDNFNQFIEGLYTSVPQGDMTSMFTENVDYDSQKFIYVKTDNNLITCLRLFKGGYVYAPEVGFFQVEQSVFDAFWNTLPVTASETITAAPTDTSTDVAAPVTVMIDSTSYPVGTASITLYIINSSAEDMYYGADYSIEEFTDNSWSVVPATADLMFIEIAYLLDANSKQEFVIDLSQLNPNLAAGSYRIVKNINGSPFYVEFELTN
ncbi:MAG: immunoglobulin-like domain-containing protein [Mobilitalea sp.]